MTIRDILPFHFFNVHMEGPFRYLIILFSSTISLSEFFRSLQQLSLDHHLFKIQSLPSVLHRRRKVRQSHRLPEGKVGFPESRGSGLSRTWKPALAALFCPWLPLLLPRRAAQSPASLLWWDPTALPRLLQESGDAVI